MKRMLAVALVGMLPLLAACKGHTGSASPSATPNPQFVQAQALVQRCAAHSNFLTKTGRQAFYHCVAPPGQEAAVQACLGKALASDGVLTKAARLRFENDAAKCVVANPTPTKGPKK